MVNLRVAIFIFAVVISLFSSTANGKLITKCIGAYAQECSDQESPAGIEMCCSLMANLYKTDTDCLCSIYEYIGMDNEAANKKLSTCGINTKVPFSCNLSKDRILHESGGSSSSLISPSLAPESPSAESPIANTSTGYKKITINGISRIMSFAFLSLFVFFIVA